MEIIRYEWNGSV